MENIAEVMKLIEAGLQQDQTKVFNYSQLLINKLESKGDVQTADKLKKILKNIKTLTIKAQGYEQILKSPVDTESRLPLAEIKHFPKDSIFLSLNQNIKTDIQEFINLLNNADSFLDKGIKIHRSVLLFGPPGTGKTQTAKYIASQTNLPLITVRIDGLVSSYLGSTSKNIRALFDFVEKTPCILFLDEFDAIAKMRDDSNELGELKRVVNSLLQNIDSIESKVPVIAATNHEHMLDPAVWRRFDYKIKIDLPDVDQRQYLIKEFLNDNIQDDKIFKILVEMTNNFSGAEIETFCNQIRTNLVMDQKSSIQEKDLMDYYIKFKNRNGKGNEKFIDDSENSKLLLAKSFREQNEKVFTIRSLSELTGISIGKLSQDLNAKGDSYGKR
jgi:SpoVK/Ycf46/Vps4 family AAA+-type ATPase